MENNGLCDDLFVKNKKLNIVVALFVCMYPFKEMATAGALSTTVGYLWIVVAAFFGFALLKKSGENKGLKWYEALLYIISVLYASGQEQMCICLIVIFSITGFCAQKHKNRSLCLWSVIGEIISLANACVLFRVALGGGRIWEAKSYFPDFYSLSFIEKFEMAFSSTVDRIVFDYAIFGILLFCLVGIPLFT